LTEGGGRIIINTVKHAKALASKEREGTSMHYDSIVEGIFLSRPNRFIANVRVGDEEVVCHVKNTGRCRELLREGARVILSRSDNPSRKTAYDLVAVYKGDTLFNMDSQAPNAAMGEWLKSSGYFPDLTLLKPECRFQNSRFDFYLETAEKKVFIEVKGVTLEREGVLLFPDAPTERGAKHIDELIAATEAGYEAYAFFVIQTETCRYFTPNAETDPAFAKALREAHGRGVKICAVTCRVTPDSMAVDQFVPVVLENAECP